MGLTQVINLVEIHSRREELLVVHLAILAHSRQETANTMTKFEVFLALAHAWIVSQDLHAMDYRSPKSARRTHTRTQRELIVYHAQRILIPQDQEAMESNRVAATRTGSKI